MTRLGGWIAGWVTFPTLLRLIPISIVLIAGLMLTTWRPDSAASC